MKYKWLPIFDVEKCSGCRACTSYCASGSLSIDEGQVSFKDPEACLSDGFCARECPSGGIFMGWLPIRSSHSSHGIVVDQKPPQF